MTFPFFCGKIRWRVDDFMKALTFSSVFKKMKTVSYTWLFHYFMVKWYGALFYLCKRLHFLSFQFYENAYNENAFNLTWQFVCGCQAFCLWKRLHFSWLVKALTLYSFSFHDFCKRLHFSHDLWKRFHYPHSVFMMMKALTCDFFSNTIRKNVIKMKALTCFLLLLRSFSYCKRLHRSKKK